MWVLTRLVADEKGDKFVFDNYDKKYKIDIEKMVISYCYINLVGINHNSFGGNPIVKTDLVKKILKTKMLVIDQDNILDEDEVSLAQLNDAGVSFKNIAKIIQKAF